MLKLFLFSAKTAQDQKPIVFWKLNMKRYSRWNYTEVKCCVDFWSVTKHGGGAGWPT